MRFSIVIFRGSYGPSLTGKSRKFQNAENRVLELEIRYRELQNKRGKKALAKMRELVAEMEDVNSNLKGEITLACAQRKITTAEQFQEKIEFIRNYFGAYTPTENKQ